MFDWRAERLLGVFCRRFLAFYSSSRQFDQVSFSLGAFSKMFTCFWSNGNDKYWSTRCVIYSFNHTQLNCFDYACEKWSSFCQQIWSVRCVFWEKFCKGKVNIPFCEPFKPGRNRFWYLHHLHVKTFLSACCWKRAKCVTIVYRNEIADHFRCLFAAHICVCVCLMWSSHPASECHYWKTLGENQMTSMLSMSSERNWESKYFIYTRTFNLKIQNIKNSKYMQNESQQFTLSS